MPSLAKQIPQWVLDRFTVCPESKTGLAWAEREVNGRNISGQHVGGCCQDGYWRVETGKYRGFAHRIVWTLANGHPPSELQIDHIDGNGLNNRLKNLQLVTNIQNSNLRNFYRAASTGGMAGVYAEPRLKDKPWRARIVHMGTRVNIGRFDTMEEAGRARDQWYLSQGIKPRYLNFDV